jgi:hypothetical protein
MTLPMMALTSKKLLLKGSLRFHSEFATATSLMQMRLIDVEAADQDAPRGPDNTVLEIGRA